jgi:hypothetical protein
MLVQADIPSERMKRENRVTERMGLLFTGGFDPCNYSGATLLFQPQKQRMGNRDRGRARDRGSRFEVKSS